MYLDNNFLLMSAMGIVLSLFTVKMTRVFVGVGMFFIVFTLFYSITQNFELSLFLGIGIGTSFNYLFEQAIQNNDIYLALLLVFVAFLGVVAFFAFLNNVWNLEITVPYFDEGIGPFSCFRKIIHLYKELLYALNHF